MFADMGDIVTLRSIKNVKQGTEIGETWEGKRSGGWEKVNKKGRNRELRYPPSGQHVVEFLTKSCMFAYEWYCMTMYMFQPDFKPLTGL